MHDNISVDAGQLVALQRIARDATFTETDVPHKHHYRHGTLDDASQARVRDILDLPATAEVHVESYTKGDYRLFSDDGPDGEALIIRLTDEWKAEWDGNVLELSADGIEVRQTPARVTGRYAIKYLNHHAAGELLLLVVTLR